MAVDQSQPLKNKIKQNKTEQNKTVSKLICYLICFSFSCSWRLPMIRIDGITNFDVHGPIRAHKKVAGRLLHCDSSWRRRSSHHIFPLLSFLLNLLQRNTQIDSQFNDPKLRNRKRRKLCRKFDQNSTSTIVWKGAKSRNPNAIRKWKIKIIPKVVADFHKDFF